MYDTNMVLYLLLMHLEIAYFHMTLNSRTDVRFPFHKIGFYQFSAGWWTVTEIDSLMKVMRRFLWNSQEKSDLPGER